MEKKRIILALGGNALQKDTKDSSAKSQLEMAKLTAKSVVDLISAGHEIAIVHGNGPQVGQIVSAYEEAKDREMPFPECGAMSQGYIGYHLQQAIRGEMRNRGIDKGIASIVTQVLVDKDDPGFLNPTKPIGSFFTEKEAKKLEEVNGYTMKEDAGRGFRRVVPSPEPIDIVESSTIKSLVEAGNIVIAAGGGGVPVIDKGNNSLEGIAAVIDKDFAAAKLGEILEADMLIILTAVEKVYINYNKPEQRGLDNLTVAEAEKLMEEGHFAAGSMLPKIKAAIKFVKNNPNRKALITSLENASEGIEGKTGTLIINQ